MTDDRLLRMTKEPIPVTLKIESINKHESHFDFEEEDTPTLLVDWETIIKAATDALD